MERLKALDEAFYDNQGELDKIRLARYMFASEENCQRINGIIHPAVRKDLRAWYSSHTDSLVAVESAILYESHFETEVDKVLFVDAPLEVRVQRAMERDGADRNQVEQRMQCQNPSVARSKADFVLLNDGENDIETELNHIIKKLC